MASLDIGIDLGTSTVFASNANRSLVIKEPSVVAVNRKTGEVTKIGEEVYQMIGRTPPHIDVIRPLADGVISDYKMTGVMINYILKKICRNQIVKPRVIVCVPSVITGVESQSVIDATVEAGARQVFLMEEPVAAAIGAGLDICIPNGNLIVDIGGGTCDVAVLSMGGIVCKTSLKTAGQKFDAAIIRYIRATYGLLIGEKTAEDIKIQIGSVWEEDEDAGMEAKGRDLVSGLPRKQPIRRSELRDILREEAMNIIQAVQNVLERTPPELVGDIRTNGIVMTGGGSLLSGLDRLLERHVKVEARVAENAVECVSIGTSLGFGYLGTLFDGFVQTATHVH